jgi:hypothetical protein
MFQLNAKNQITMTKVAVTILALAIIGAVNVLEMGTVENFMEVEMNQTFSEMESDTPQYAHVSSVDDRNKDSSHSHSDSYDGMLSSSKQEHTSLRVSKDQLFDCSDSVDRFSQRNVQASKIQSPFNCFLPNAKCKYYYPANFFDTSCGIGKEYSHYLKTLEEKRLNRTLWNFMPAMGYPTLTLNYTCLQNGKHFSNGVTPTTSDSLHDIGPHYTGDTVCITERLSFLHVHKVGGTSLHAALNYMSMSKSSSLQRHKFFTPSHSPDATPKKKQGGEDNPIFTQTKEALAHAIKYPVDEFGPEQHVMFAFVRDPLERFISSIGQATGASGSTSNKISGVLNEKCLKETSRETLTCISKYVRDNGFWIELHFTPQVIDISFTTLYSDVPVALFPFQELKSILTYLGRGDAHGRDGTKSTYRTDEVFTNMNVSDYDEESIEIVCKIYEMDVLMQRSMGLEVPRCDPYVPQHYSFDDFVSS